MASISPNETNAVFWALGLLNNIAFVVMIACAKSISEGGTALVFLANIIPGLTIKLTSPYWFDRVSYHQRIKAASVLSVVSFLIVSIFSHRQEMEVMASLSDSYSENEYEGSYENSDEDKGQLGLNVIMQLIGVALCSAQGGLGEATFLALCGKVDSIIASIGNGIPSHQGNDYEDQNEHNEINSGFNYDGGMNESKDQSACITAFASGTGLAGVAGFTFIFVFTKVFKMKLYQALLVALVFPVFYWNLYLKVAGYATMEIYEGEKDESESGARSSVVGTNDEISQPDAELQSLNDHPDEFTDNHSLQASTLMDDTRNTTTQSNEVTNSGFNSDEMDNRASINDLSPMRRLQLTLSLWPYMIPLFTVYFAEYALQSGVWTAIGFPVDDEAARGSFYVASNWMYQVGVFLSRSSGTLFTVSMPVLWLMPMLQFANLIFFYYIAIDHFWYDYSLLIMCFFVGLLGGGVYVHGYIRINKDLPPNKREFALSTASVADSFGIMFADLSGLYIQSCLYSANALSGAAVTCPLR